MEVVARLQIAHCSLRPTPRRVIPGYIEMGLGHVLELLYTPLLNGLSVVNIICQFCWLQKMKGVEFQIVASTTNYHVHTYVG